MNIKFNNIIIDGFLSFDHEEINLADLGVVQIKGINNYEPLAESNGSGKSAIIEAIVWVITGYTPRGATIVANNILNKGVYVKLDLNIDTINYVITRSKSHCDLGTTLSIIKDGEDISGSTVTKSKDILQLELGSNLDYDILTSIIILSQGLPGRLSTLKPSSRKSRLEELSRTDQYLDDLQSKLSNSTESINAEYSKIKSSILECDTKINTSNFNIGNASSKISEIESKSTDLINEELYNKLINDIVPELKKEIDNANSVVYDIDTKKRDYDYKVIQLQQEFNKRKSDNTDFINKYSSIHNSTCPTCGQMISNQDKLTELRNNISASMANNKIELKRIIDQIDEFSKKSEVLKSELISNNEELNNLKLELSKYQSQINDYKVYSQSTSALIESIDEYKKVIEEESSKKKLYEDQLSSVEKDLSIASYYKNQISRKFRSFLLEGVIAYLNSKCSEYSKYLFEKQGDVQLRIDGNNIGIYLGDRDFENLSGGEGRRVDIILQLVQRDLARNESGFSSNLLVLDEILDNLDSIGADSVINLLEYKSPDIDTLMIVSHKKDILIPCDNIMMIVKEDTQISHIYKGE